MAGRGSGWPRPGQPRRALEPHVLPAFALAWGSISDVSPFRGALWDLQAKRLGLPLSQLLGGPLRRNFRVYFTHWGASLKSHRTPETFQDWAQETRARKWTAVKWTLAAEGSEAERIAQNVRGIRGSPEGCLRFNGHLPGSCGNVQRAVCCGIRKSSSAVPAALD